MVTLQDKVAQAMTIHEEIQKAVTQLKTCPLQPAQFAEAFKHIHKVMEPLRRSSQKELRPNILFWVDMLNQRLESILSVRLGEVLASSYRRGEGGGIFRGRRGTDVWVEEEKGFRLLTQTFTTPGGFV